MNDDTTFYLDFVNNYYQKYFAYPQKYAYSAYQQSLYFYPVNSKDNFTTFPNTSFQSNTKFNICYDDFENHSQITIK